MENKLRQFPKTNYEDLVKYGIELKAAHGAFLLGRNLVSKDEVFSEELIFDSLKNKLEKIKERYNSLFDWNDYYSFASLNELESFLMSTNFFEEKRVKKEINLYANKFSLVLEEEINSLHVNCWLAKNNKNLVKYVPSVGVGVKNFDDFKKSYGFFADSSEKRVFNKLSDRFREDF